MRNLSAYELNQLNKHQIIPKSLNWDDLASKPIEYITGFCEFYGRDFIVNKNVLIPRVETERIIDLALKNLTESKRTKTKKLMFCDVGSGSGCIGLTFALELKKRNIKFKGYLSDISEEAIKVINQNIKSFNIKQNDTSINVLQSDLFENYSSKLKFDFIFANLPYIPTKRIKSLDSSVKDYEPILALDGGENGTQLLEKFLDQSTYFIKKNGVILMEVDDTHVSVPENHKELWNVEYVKDINDKNRFWILTRKKL